MSRLQPSEDKGVTPISTWTILAGALGVLVSWVALNPDVTNVPENATWVDLGHTLVPALFSLGGALLAWYKDIKPKVTPTESPKIEVDGRLLRLVPEKPGTPFNRSPGGNS